MLGFGLFLLYDTSLIRWVSESGFRSVSLFWLASVEYLKDVFFFPIWYLEFQKMDIETLGILINKDWSSMWILHFLVFFMTFIELDGHLQIWLNYLQILGRKKDVLQSEHWVFVNVWMVIKNEFIIILFFPKSRWWASYLNCNLTFKTPCNEISTNFMVKRLRR